MIANDPPTSAARSTPTAPTRPPASCSSATRFGLPLLFLCDTPGFMVGPEAEQTATVRHFARMFVTGANLDGADRHDRPAQGLRPRRPGDGRRRLQGAAVHGRLADVGVRRRWGSRGRSGSACAASSRRSRTRASASGLRGGRRGRLRARQGDQHGRLLRDRRRDRPGRQPALDRDPVRPRPRRGTAGTARTARNASAAPKRVRRSTPGSGPSGGLQRPPPEPATRRTSSQSGDAEMRGGAGRARGGAAL